MVIPAYNAGKTLGRCLDSLSKQTRKPLEIILVDDCSGDDTAALASDFGVKVISFDERYGPARARNRGAEEARGDIVLFLDSDVVIPPDMVERIEAAFGSNEEIKAVQTLYSPLCPAEDMVSRYQNFYYYYALHRMKGDFTATFATWCAAVRKNAFEDAGGFNVSIPEPTVEDEELGYEIADRGGKILLARELQVTHLASYQVGQFVRRRLRMARAQAKSGWRSIRDRLLRRYVNLRETGTHHSRWVVLSIMLVLLSEMLLAAWLAAVFMSSDSWPYLLASSVFVALLSLICHLRFLKTAASFFGAGILMGFIPLCIMDMAVLGWGIIGGTFQFFSGRHY